MRCIVGLGNPGKEYERSFHNVGFEILNRLIEKLQPNRSFKKFKAECHLGTYRNSNYLLVFPQTFMNLSGESLIACKHFYKLETEDFLVVCDDLNLPPGQTRYREKGSAGGHNGLKSIIRNFSSENFGRLRIGIGRPENKEQVTPYVLGKISKQTQEILEPAYESALEAILEFIEKGRVQIHPQTSK